MAWTEENNRLIKEFKLESFSAITAALPKIAEVADSMDHHPDFEVFGYNKIRFSLNTHTSNSVTELDYQLAEKIDQILEA